MLDNIATLNIGSASQISAQTYHRLGASSVNLSGEARYSSNVEINAEAYHHHEVCSSDPVKDLYAHVAVGCMHNSADCVDAPKCHKETRKAVQADIFSWISTDARAPSHLSTPEILWLTGPAGAGKSAIMGSVSEKLEKDGLLAATFFFSSYTGSARRMSKRGLVTTLAYQLLLHPDLKKRVSSPMLSAIRSNPAIFEMNLKRQFEVLILEPLRAAGREHRSGSLSPLAILIDGVDECREPKYDNSGRTRQDDQIEVLSLLFQAAMDPVFDFRIVVASRPETWIRSFFSDITTGKITELFLDNRYSPDADIRLFLKSKFAELCRKYGINPTSWPSEEAMEKLVQDASGQFIYAATVVRFIATPSQLPQAQLEIVLRVKVEDRSNPFSALDALYTSILKTSPNHHDTVLWLKALQILKTLEAGEKKDAWGRIQKPPACSAWTIDRLFEGCAGQARMLLGLPSLVYTCEASPGLPCDASCYGDELLSQSMFAGVGWNEGYAFYHKSFLDYLEDPLRCGIAFPDICQADVERWVWARCIQTLKCGGPEVPIDPTLLPTFRRCFLDILTSIVTKNDWNLAPDNVDTVLSQCNPGIWLDIPKSSYFGAMDFPRTILKFAHKDATA